MQDAEGLDDVVDLKGRCVIPGLIDSHCHLLSGINRAAMDVIDIPPETPPGELGKVILSKISERDYPDDQLISAMGIDLSRGEFSAENIDCAVPDRPVMVFFGDGHALLLNSRAMELLGIDKDTKDPSDQSFFKRYPDGKPTGLVIEIPAIKYCWEQVKKDDADPAEVIKALCREYASYGYASVFEAASFIDGENDVFESLKAIDEEEGLDLRLSLSFCWNGGDGDNPYDAVRIMKDMRDGSSEHVICDTLKMISDGTIEEHSALLYEPYEDEPDNKGFEMIPEPDMEKMARLAAEEGFNIHIHAIGDRAAGLTLDILKGLGNIKGTKTIAHNQVYSGSEIKKISEAGDIFFQTTPQWLASDSFTYDCLGEKRYAMQFPIGTMTRNRVTVTFGSDSCLDEATADAFLGMYYAAARGDASCKGICFPPETEGISRSDALLAYTINGAAQLGFSDETGSIEPGKSADFVILDRDIMECSLEELKDTEVLETYFCGRRTF